jgi:hypothetical protein
MSDRKAISFAAMCCGLLILFIAFVIELVELGIVASLDNNEIKIPCAETLFTWVYVSTIYGTITNGCYLLFFCCFLSTMMGEFKGKSDSASMSSCFFCHAGVICVSCVVCIFVLPRFALFGYGIYLIDILDDQCKDSIGSAYGFIIAGLVSMVFSSIGKFIVTSAAMME